MEGQPGQGLSVRRDPALGVERLQAFQQRDRLRPGRLGRRVEEGHLPRIGNAPGCKVEGKTRQIGLQHFRPVERVERGRLPFAPQAIADARLGSAGATASLVGRRS
jgi:hypothetical protein